MRQILYISTAVTGMDVAEVQPILATSRRNNLINWISGLLYFDGTRFLQALEGEPAAVSRTLSRIERDPRHRAIVILSDRDVPKREFGDWSMAYRTPGADAEQLLATVADLVARSSLSVCATFMTFAEVRRAA